MSGCVTTAMDFTSSPSAPASILRRADSNPARIGVGAEESDHVIADVADDIGFARDAVHNLQEGERAARVVIELKEGQRKRRLAAIGAPLLALQILPEIAQRQGIAERRAFLCRSAGSDLPRRRRRRSSGVRAWPG